MRFELRKSLRSKIIEWGKHQCKSEFFFAVHSAAKGAWDDVKRDLQKHRISFDETNQIVEKFFDFGMISERQCTSYKEHFLEELN